MEIKTKTAQAIEAFKNGSLKQAFRLMLRFRGFSKEEKRAIQIAYECMAGKEAFYVSLGINPEEIIGKAAEYVSLRYHISSNLHQG